MKTKKNPRRCHKREWFPCRKHVSVRAGVGHRAGEISLPGFVCTSRQAVSLRSDSMVGGVIECSPVGSIVKKWLRNNHRRGKAADSTLRSLKFWIMTDSRTQGNGRDRTGRERAVYNFGSGTRLVTLQDSLQIRSREMGPRTGREGVAGFSLGGC